MMRLISLSERTLMRRPRRCTSVVTPHHHSRGTSEYCGVGHYVMIWLKLRQDKCEACKQTYYKEEYERIGECQQKACHEIAPVVCCLYIGGLKRACGVLAEEIQAENCQNDTAYKLKQELVPVDKLGHEAQPETRKQTIDKVAQSGSHACKNRPAPFAESTLDYEHAYRPHWCRDKACLWRGRVAICRISAPFQKNQAKIIKTYANTQIKVTFIVFPVLISI